MKLSPKQWCNIQEKLANLTCPDCFTSKIKLKDEVEGSNAECEDCGCKFEFNPDIAPRSEFI